MHAIELPADIDQNHQIHLQLPKTVKAGKAKVIVMYEDVTSPLQANSLVEFLNELPVPANNGLSRDEVQQYIQQERHNWD